MKDCEFHLFCMSCSCLAHSGRRKGQRRELNTVSHSLSKQSALEGGHCPLLRRQWALLVIVYSYCLQASF